METLKAILTRRSIRKFYNQKIAEEQINKLLEAAMYAPSAKNTQPWHFVVIDKKELLERITQIHPFAEMCNEASHAILVCGDRQLEKLEGYIALDCGAATQNILLAAHDLGLGAVWLGVYPRTERIDPISKLFNLPENIIPVSLVAIGIPSEKKDAPQRFNPSRIHFNTM